MLLKDQYDGGMSDKTDIKIFILFLLDEINYPLDYRLVHDIVSENGFVGRFDFAECFSELTELGHITSWDEQGTIYYLISPLGHMVATELQGTLLDSIRERSRVSAMRLLSLHKRGATCSCTIEKSKDGKFSVRCTVLEKGETFMDTTLAVPTQTEAETIKKHFEEKPEEVCRGVLSVLTGKIDYYMHG